jgi:putative PIN family toxin of toxin-antitoxin system
LHVFAGEAARIMSDSYRPNVLISGSFFPGIPSRILDACIKGRFELVVSQGVVDEYHRVGEEFSGSRPNRDFDALLTLLLEKAVMVDPPALNPGICRDADDDKFIACAIQGRAVAIVTGDKDLLDVGDDLGIEILTPRGFMTKYLPERGR